MGVVVRVVRVVRVAGLELEAFEEEIDVCVEVEDFEKDLLKHGSVVCLCFGAEVSEGVFELAPDAEGRVEDALFSCSLFPGEPGGGRGGGSLFSHPKLKGALDDPGGRPCDQAGCLVSPEKGDHLCLLEGESEAGLDEGDEEGGEEDADEGSAKGTDPAESGGDDNVAQAEGDEGRGLEPE